MNRLSQRYDSRTFIIGVDSYENGVPVGQFCNLVLNKGGSFDSITQLLLKLEKSLDLENMPQAFEKVRTFFPVTHAWTEDEEQNVCEKGKMATFVIHILYRRNASWQGTLHWLDEGKVQHFRSVLELIMLMNSALEEESDPEWNGVVGAVCP